MGTNNCMGFLATNKQKTLTWLRKVNFKRETIAAQNNAIITNHIKERIDKTQKNKKKNKIGLCDDQVETINHIIS